MLLKIRLLKRSDRAKIKAFDRLKAKLRSQKFIMVKPSPLKVWSNLFSPLISFIDLHLIFDCEGEPWYNGKVVSW